jgi:hypothetical protein
MKADAVLSARQDAEAVIAKAYTDLEAHEWDLNATAPYPDSLRDGREEYRRKQAKHNLYSSLTRADSNTYVRRGPKLVHASDEGAARFIDLSEREAAAQYDSFICKMVGKVGEVTATEIAGDHVWGHSILTVTLPDGTVQRWKTQQIINYSVYGRPYLQWPSRIVK